MKIGFLISGIGIYGSVREVVENCNVLTDLGHECFIFNPEGEKVAWIKSKAKAVYQSKLINYELDALILCTTPNNTYLNLFETSKAKIKIFCFMGFDPKFDIFDLNPNLKHIVENYYLTADGMWQIEWLKNNTASTKIIECQLGGINLEMFTQVKGHKFSKKTIGWSGDHRKRKGGETLIKYFRDNKIPTVTYFNKGIRQDDMKHWFSNVSVFIDNHYSGGWCNPVMEAMSCGVPVICSDIECNKSFAIHNETCLKFDFNDMEMLNKNLKLIKSDEALRERLVRSGYEMAKKFDYRVISKQFETKLIELI
jgi:glycosyltransferase involved in cell wall biosynthesis